MNLSDAAIKILNALAALETLGAWHLVVDESQKAEVNELIEQGLVNLTVVCRDVVAEHNELQLTLSAKGRDTNVPFLLQIP